MRGTDLKELALIQRIRQASLAQPGRAVTLGIGDDCAILRPGSGMEIVVTTDFSLEGRHFRRDWHSPESAGYRCLARGLSDIAAMSAKPMAAFLSLALPAGTKDAWVRRFFAGLRVLAERYEVPLAGGDTAQAPGEFIVADIVVVGSVPTGTALRRSGAQAGDRLYVTGSLGGAAAELERMQTGQSRRVRSGSAEEHPQMFPEPRIEVGERLRKRGWATACLDLSDGLSSDLAHLCRESGVGAEIDAARLPIDERATLEQALHGGEDYELLFAALSTARLPKKIAGVAITEIGRMTLDKRIWLTEAARKKRLKPRGWEHFRS